MFGSSTKHLTLVSGRRLDFLGVRETDDGDSGPEVLGRRDAQTCSQQSSSRRVLRIDCFLVISGAESKDQSVSTVSIWMYFLLEIGSYWGKIIN